MDRYQFADCISDYLENKIPLSKRKEFEKYLKSHPEGLELMYSVQEVIDSMKSISETKVSPDFMNNLQMRIIREKERYTSPSSERKTYFGFAPLQLGMMAVVLIGLISIGKELLPEKGVMTTSNQPNIQITYPQNIPDPNPQLIKLQDLLKQKNTLSRYKDLLEMEREVTLKRQFKRFMNIIGIEDQKVVDNYFPSFRNTLVVMDNEDLSTKQRLISIVESEFLFDIMRLKTTSRERELRRVTKELSTFISKAALDTQDEDTLFAQRLLSNTLRVVATEIEPKENRQPNQPMLDAWVEALRTGMEEYLENM